MKASFYALLALLAISLSACTTINPMGAHATVYPAGVHPVVVDSSVPAVAPVVEPAVAQTPTQVEPATDSAPALMVEVSESDLQCMALAIYHEARGEPERGQAAVGYVILNRVEHPRYPKTVCGVVRDSNSRGCQFSWFCDGKSDKPRDMDSYVRAREIAIGIFNKSIPNPVGHAIYFDGYVHGSKRKPGQIQIANQRFYADYRDRSPRPHSRR